MLQEEVKGGKKSRKMKLSDLEAIEEDSDKENGEKPQNRTFSGIVDFFKPSVNSIEGQPIEDH